MEQEALARAEGHTALTNYPAIVTGFMEKGIPAGEIEPRVNVFTYHAWRAKGRQVRRGEHGVKVITFVEIRERDPSQEGEDRPEGPQRRPGSLRAWTATVFHVSQTDPIGGVEA